MDHVVTVFLTNEDALLLQQRSDEVGTYQGRWAGVSGYVEDDDAGAREAAERELREEVGAESADPIRGGDPVEVHDPGSDEREARDWTVHPFLYRADSRQVDPNWEIREHEWVEAPEILARETVPALWTAYRRVAPSVETLAGDEARGSAALSRSALRALRDAAAEAAHAEALADDPCEESPTVCDWNDLTGLARDLREARPSMAVVENRVNRAMYGTDAAEAVADRASRVLRDARGAGEEAAALAAERLADLDGDATVLTRSRSGTALAALRERLAADDSPALVVAESRPGGEGAGVAADLADAGDVTLVADSAVPWVLAGETAVGAVDAALVGADTVLADGGVVNKVGTRGLGLACAREGVPLYVVAAGDKVAPRETFENEPAPEGNLVAPDGVGTANPLFDRTPADCVDALLTEDGALDGAGVGDLAETHAEWAGWDE